MNTFHSIKSFAILDIETTNLPQFNFNKVKITEISIHGISIKDIQTGNINKLPRVIHKLTMAFNPFMLIHPEATNVTGLDNLMLENESKFDENSSITLISFLKRLQQPTCLIAHNGMYFDFPIIKKSLMKLGKEFPSDFLCVDSLVAFQEIDESKTASQIIKTSIETANSSNNFQNQNVQSEMELSLMNSIDSGNEIHLKDSESKDNEYLTENLNELTSNETMPIDYFKDIISSSEILAIEELEATLMKNNETTPKRPTNANNFEIDISKRRKTLEDMKTAIKLPIQLELKHPKCKKTLFPNLSPRKKYPPKGIYKLENMYKRIFKENPKCTHHAEADVEMLEKIILYYGEKFIQYAELNAIPFSNIPNI